MPLRSSLLLTCLRLAVTAAAQACSTSTLASSVPTATEVAFNEYSYCGGTLNTSAYIKNVNYNKIVTLYYSDSNDQVTPLTVVQLGYDSGIEDTAYESWTSVTPDVFLDGITRLVNITYRAVDVGQTYVQLLNETVTASGPAPTTSAPPVPYATPRGFSQDTTDWLRVKGGTCTEAPLAKQRMFKNIEVTGAAPGTIVAAQSYDNPDYGYNWVRDSSLTMDVVATLYAAATDSRTKQVYESLFFRYAKARTQEQIAPDTITGLGEPKFNLDGTAFTGPWGRPQNDGPATAAIALMEFANNYLDTGGSIARIRQKVYQSNLYPDQAPLRKDLLFVAQNWFSPSFDLWEEEESTHFYTRLVQHRAMRMGSGFANRLGDPYTARTLTAAANRIQTSLTIFYNERRNLILYEYGPVLRGKSSFKDCAVQLATIHGYNGDGFFAFSNDQVLATTWQLVTSFLPIYPIANMNADAQGRTLGIPVGRYPEDEYDGVGFSRGNMWYLCTSTIAENLYRAAMEFQSAGQIIVSNSSLPFWRYFSPQNTHQVGRRYRSNTAQFQQMISSLQGWGDAFMRRIRCHTPQDGHLSEEVDRDSGRAVGAIDLTWSYASLLTASFARAQAIGNKAYIRNLANIYVTTNSTKTSA